MMNYATDRRAFTRRFQSGVMTTFTGVLILVMLTLMVFFAMRVGVFEQRVSANEMRQKLAFHAAESGIHHAKEYVRANAALVTSSDGWLNAGTGRWRLCSDAPGISLSNGQTGDHPCFVESRQFSDSDGNVRMRREDMFYFSNDLTAEVEDIDTWSLPVDTAGSVINTTTEAVDVFALLCILEVHEGEPIPVQGCVPSNIDTDLEDDIVTDGTYFMVTLMARGQADCFEGACTAEALVSEQVSNFGAASGGNSPAVPLTVKSTADLSGTVGVVANPNAGGVGVPGSIWLNANPACSSGVTYSDSSGSWDTCELNEWYETESIPEGVACEGNCQCDANEAISSGRYDGPGIDMIEDLGFPCDLFQFYFGIPRAHYEVVKGYSKIITNCNYLADLGEDASGIYWVTGPTCAFNANDVVGSPDAPVLIITAASATNLGGGVQIFGSVFSTDVEDPDAVLTIKGNGQIYGALMVDSDFSASNATGSTFDVVWNENILKKAGTQGGLGAVIGGWSDFHRDWTFAQQEGS